MTHWMWGLGPEAGSGVNIVKFQPEDLRNDPSLQELVFLGCDDIHYQQPFAEPGRAVDVLWPRTNMMGAAYGMGAINPNDAMVSRWEWDWPATGKAQRKKISGIVRDANGSPVAGATVQVFNTSTGLLVDTVTSAADGSYSAGDPNAVTCFAVGYKTGSPDTEGTTVNTLTGS